MRQCLRTGMTGYEAGEYWATFISQPDIFMKETRKMTENHSTDN